MRGWRGVDGGGARRGAPGGRAWGPRGSLTVLGVTGGLGTGKSTVARLFGGLGAQVIDADAVAHRVLARDAMLQRRLVARFGRGILGRGRRIQRQRLGRAAFRDPAGVRALARITHPSILREIRAELAALARRAPGAVVVVDAPLLIEVGWARKVDCVVVVTATLAQQLRRVARRTGLRREEVLARLVAQLALPAKVRWADWCIDNSQSLAHTRAQVRAVWAAVQRDVSSAAGRAGRRSRRSPKEAAWISRS